MRTAGDELKRHRGEESQADFGKRFRASQAQVSRLEAGLCCPTVDQAVAIEEEFGIHVERWPWTGAMASIVRRRHRRAS